MITEVTNGVDAAKEQIVEKLLAAVQKESGGNWFKSNRDLLRTKFLAAFPDMPTVPADTNSPEPVVKMADYLALNEAHESLKNQLIENVDANQTLNTAYQEAHKALIDIGVVLMGTDKLKTHAPLTTEKLYGIITDEVSRLSTSGGSQAEGWSDAVVWAKTRLKNLSLIGAGPLATGRYEGEKDTLNQLIKAAR